MEKRPSHREVDKRLKEAKGALQEREVLFANPSKAVGEISELNIGDTEELKSLLLELLDEISLIDYAGSSPPQRSYEPMIADCELWAFSWRSLRLKREMYLKFALKDSLFYLVSIHQSKKVGLSHEMPKVQLHKIKETANAL